jgi:tetratricopeptide (TPR) repeat protein
MSENQSIYEEQMFVGDEAAWNQDWTQAANAYGRALQESPNDLTAHLSLGFALLRLERLNEALRVYNRAHQLAPEDPIPMEKSADVLQKMGRLKEAARQYANVADLYLKQRDIDKAISSWEKATELTPGLVLLHSKLAKAYVRIGDRRRALYQYLMLAFNFSRSGDHGQAVKAAQRALQINRRSTEALNALRAAEAGSEVKAPTPVQGSPSSSVAKINNIDWSQIVEIGTEEPTTTIQQDLADPLGPMGAAMSGALSQLAEYIMMSGGFDVGGVEALQAMEFQRQGLHSEAINAYQRASSSLQHPALNMNLGALLLLSEQTAEAIAPLEDAYQDDSLRPGALHALGQVNFRQGKYQTAAKHLSQAAYMAEREFTTDVHELEQVTQFYPALQASIKQRKEKDDLLQAVCRRFVGLLSGNEWPRRLHDVGYQLAEVNRESGGEGLLEWLAQPIDDDVPESIAKIDRYIRQQLYTLAIDEAQYAIEKAPSYLPIHVRMAEVMMLEGRVRQAINKYNTVAKTYRVRGENGRAASILFEVLETAPLDVDVRRNLISLLEGEERLDEALDQYIELASTYRKLGNLDSSRNTFIEAEGLMSRVELPPAKLVAIKHQMADIDMLRLDVRRAQRVYEEIIGLDPTDEKARKNLVEINLQIGNQIEGIRQLDALLRIYAKRKQVKNILNVLLDLVRSYPDDSGLRSRLAAIFRQLRRKDEAIEQMDKLADLQLDAGLADDACDTIRQIIKLNPPNVDQYKQLLEKLNCG